MQRHLIHALIAALCLPALTACGGQSQDASAANSAAERIIAKETRNARKPDQSRGIEMRRIGFQSVFAGTAIGYGATFKQENLIDLELSAHRLDGQQMIKSSAHMTNLPMAQGEVTIDASQSDGAPGMTLTGVPGYEDVSMRMNKGTLTIVSLTHEKDDFTGVPVIGGFEVTYKGDFLSFSDDPDKIVVNPAGIRGVTISGAVRYHKD